MPLQYICDKDGNRTAVVISIEEWRNITSVHEDLKKLENPNEIISNRKPSDYKGHLSKEEALSMIKDLKR